LLVAVAACSNKKTDTSSTTETPSTIAGEGGQVQCGEGEFIGTDGKTKVALKTAPSLYYASVDQWSAATLTSVQDVLVRGSEIVYARAVPRAIAVSVGGAAAISKTTVVPTLSLKLFEKDGQLYLAAGNYNGIDYYKVGSALEPAGSNPYLGAVTDLSARDGKLCAAADGGRAVVETAIDGCSRILYEADANLAANGKPLNAVHVAAVPEGCLAVTRNYPKVEIKLIALIDLVKSFLTSTQERIDLRPFEDKLVLLGRDGAPKVINAVVGSYDKVVFSDLDAYPEGGIATYTAFKKANWDDFSATNMVTYPSKKLLQLMKLFFEIRAGGLFVAGGEVKRNVELQGIAWSHTFNPPGGSVTINEFPHFSLPWFSEGAVEGNRYGFKTILAFSIFDFSAIGDPNVASLPAEHFTWINDPINPLSQPQNPKGLFTDFGLAEKKLFLNGFSSGSRVQANYDYDAGAKKLMDLAPYPTAFFPLKAKFNLRAFPLGVLRDGYFGLQIAPTKLFYKKAQPGATPSLFLPAQHFGAISMTDYKLAGLPVVYESPAGEAGDKFVLAYLNPTTSKLLVEALKTDGSKSAVTSAEVDLGAGATPAIGAFFAPVAVFDDLMVVAIDSISAGPTLETRIYVLKIDGDELVPMDDGVNPYIESLPGIAYSIRPLRKADGKYSVLLMSKGGGAGEKAHRIDIAHNGTDVTESNAQSIAVANIQDLVVGGDKAFAINAFGEVVPVNVAGTNLSLDAALGKIIDDPAHEFQLAFCGLRQNDVYCSGFYDGLIFQLFKFATDSKTQTTFRHQRPFLLSFTGSKLLATYDLDGGGIEVFDLSKPAPEPKISGDVPAPAEDSADGSGMENAQFGGGGGCSLNSRLP
ncbi:MAG TPA: hypothetical protein VFW62_12375, partial [bacterium]|nr:hypothetical protein [bacterium]